MVIIPWILFLIAVIVAVAGFIGQAKLRNLALEAEEKFQALEAELESSKQQPVRVATGVGPVAGIDPRALADIEKKLGSTQAEVKRLETAVTEAEKRAKSEHDKAESALQKATSAEAMVAQARSKATEAGHLAVQEARRETDAVRAELVAVQARLADVAEAEARINEFSERARQSDLQAQQSASRVKTLESEVDRLQKKLQDAETNLQSVTSSLDSSKKKWEQLTAEAVQTAEQNLRTSQDAQLRQAKQSFEQELQLRLQAERERHESEQRRLSLELDKARLTAYQAPSIPEQPNVTESAPIDNSLAAPRMRPRPGVLKTSEIGSDADEKPLVVLADSDANAVKTISKHLEIGGYSVKVASSIVEALDIARNQHTAAIALDSVNLPDGDCWKVLAEIKEDSDLRDIPVVVFAPGKDKERAIDMGAAGCLTKPVDKAVLVATIKAAMVNRKRRARLAAVTTSSRRALLTQPTE